MTVLIDGRILHDAKMITHLHIQTGEFMNTIKIITLLSLFLVIGACSQMSTTTEFDESTDFSKMKTYAWGNSTIKMERTGQAADRIMDELGVMVRDNIQPMVDAHLAAKGFELIKEGKPDFIVQYSASSTAHGADQKMRSTHSSPMLGNTLVQDTGVMMIGKLGIYMLDSNSFKKLWHGEGEIIVKGDEKRKTRLEKVINKVLEDFPPH